MSMNRFQRMIGIPEDEFVHLKSLQQTQNPTQNQFLNLSSEYNKQSQITNPHIRVQRQGETLHQMINLKDEMRKRLIEATPKPFQNRVQSLYRFVSDKLNVNAKGEMIDSDGKAIEGSNLSDLIQHAIRDRRRNMIPPGWSKFLEILREYNVPRMILNYETLDELQFKGTIAPTKAKMSPQKASKLPVAVGTTVKKAIAKKEKEKKAVFKQGTAQRISERIKQEPDYLNEGKKEALTKKKARWYI